MDSESLWVLKQVAVGVFLGGGLVLGLLMGMSRNCWEDKDDVAFVPHLRARQVDINRAELFCPCPEMARHEAAVGAGVLQQRFSPTLSPARRQAQVELCVKGFGLELI